MLVSGKKSEPLEIKKKMESPIRSINDKHRLGNRCVSTLGTLIRVVFLVRNVSFNAFGKKTKLLI